jgi:Hemerythrin HHE cation binding domain
MTTAPTPSPDPFALLEQDHRDVDLLLEELSATGSDDQRQEVLTRVQHALSVHFDFEESEIYPLVARLVGAPQADDRHAEDDAVREALGRLEAQPPGDDGYAGAVAGLRAAVARHGAIETELFPRLRDEVGPGEQEHLSATLLALREAARPAG